MLVDSPQKTEAVVKTMTEVLKQLRAPRKAMFSERVADGQVPHQVVRTPLLVQEIQLVEGPFEAFIEDRFTDGKGGVDANDEVVKIGP